MTALSDENRYKILKLLEQNPDMNQRQVANSLGISLGKTNYCLKALIDIGLLKAGNFKRSSNKSNYAYLLTPKGIDEKARVTLRFLKLKQQEFITLQQEIEELRQEASLLKSVDIELPQDEA
ncbi:MAG: MarR family EPS-associated transcriptional regulator [Thiohalomonadales bacterium]